MTAQLHRGGLLVERGAGRSSRTPLQGDLPLLTPPPPPFSPPLFSPQWTSSSSPWSSLLDSTPCRDSAAPCDSALDVRGGETGGFSRKIGESSDRESRPNHCHFPKDHAFYPPPFQHILFPNPFPPLSLSAAFVPLTLGNFQPLTFSPLYFGLTISDLFRFSLIPPN